jgi:hypothetical protein
METMAWFTASPFRPLVLIVLAQNNGAPLDEMNLAGRAGLLHQQMTGQAVETAVLIKEIIDLEQQGYIQRAADGFRWEMTDLGVLVSRQWVAGDIEPRGSGALDQGEVRGWRDRVIAVMEHDAELAERAGIERDEWLMTQSQRLVEMHVLNRVLGEERMPSWLQKMRASVEGRMTDAADDDSIEPDRSG